MRKFLIITATALICTLAAGQSQGPENESTVPIRTKEDNNTSMHRAPSLNPLVFECCVLHGQEVALLAASRDCEANVEVCNFTTGHTEDYDTVLSTSPLIIPLFGDGQYSITITLTSGLIYEGEFEL